MSTPMITVLMAQGATNTPVTLNVNGKSVTIPNNVETEIPAFFKDAAINCGFDVQILGETEEEDAPVAPSPETDDSGAAGGGGGNAPTGDQQPAPFDAEAVISGKVEDVAARLATLTPEQLEAVATAEADREQPRRGVLAAIEAAKAAKAA